MKLLTILATLLAVVFPGVTASAAPPPRQTTIDIKSQSFLINNQPTYKDRIYDNRKIEGLLLNSRMVQGIFDDLNPETRALWKYPDGSAYDAERNTREFIAAMPEWRKHGLLSFTINLQGGSPQGYSNAQPWINSTFTPEGDLRPEFMARLEKILDRADALGMVPIVGFFYFGQTKAFKDEPAIIKATTSATDWLLARNYSNVLIEITNECNQKNYPEIIKPARANELIQLVQQRSQGKVKNIPGRFYVSTSLTGGQIPNDKIARSADFLLIHGNGISKPDGIRAMVAKTRALPAYHDQPILFNEDDHFDFEKPDNNMLAAIGQYASWGYFDYRMKGEGFDEGYQSVPVNWGISSKRKQGFFDLLTKVTGEK